MHGRNFVYLIRNDLTSVVNDYSYQIRQIICSIIIGYIMSFDSYFDLIRNQKGHKELFVCGRLDGLKRLSHLNCRMTRFCQL